MPQYASIKPLFCYRYSKNKDEKSLLDMRFNCFMRLVASATKSLKPQSLPPTERAAVYHSMRVHHQVIEWKSLMNIQLEPTKNVCGTNMCTCRRTGLPCISACGHCNGTDCQNSNIVTSKNDDEEDENFDNIFDSSMWE